MAPKTQKLRFSDLPVPHPPERRNPIGVPMLLLHWPLPTDPCLIAYSTHKVVLAKILHLYLPGKTLGLLPSAEPRFRSVRPPLPIRSGRLQIDSPEGRTRVTIAA